MQFFDSPMQRHMINPTRRIESPTQVLEVFHLHKSFAQKHYSIEPKTNRKSDFNKMAFLPFMPHNLATPLGHNEFMKLHKHFFVDAARLFSFHRARTD